MIQIIIIIILFQLIITTQILVGDIQQEILVQMSISKRYDEKVEIMFNKKNRWKFFDTHKIRKYYLGTNSKTNVEQVLAI